jgi:hypothetical protein
MSGVFGGTKLASYVIAGRVMLTFSNGDDNVSFVAADDDGDPQMGLQSINATLPSARAMVEEVIREWESSTLPENERYKADAEVGLRL